MPDDSGGSLRVFVAEDEALVRVILAEMLADLGHEVVAEACKLEAAVRLAAEADYDLAILDLNLGHGLSCDAAEAVRKRGKAMVLATGYGRAGLTAGYENCVVLQKPFTRDDVARAIGLA